MKNRFIPDEKYNFPVSGTRNLRFQRKWLIEFPWLIYSKKCDGAFCHFCFFFCSIEVGKGSHTNAKSFVNQPFKRWKDAKETFRYHQSLEYHKKALIIAENFKDVHDKKIVSIDLQLDKARKVEIEQNRRILSSIVETIILIGRQEIAYRGHRDSGPISLEPPIANDGNFRSLLRFRMSAGDDALKKHLQAPSLNKLYTSPQIQNELIEICGSIILEKIVSKVNEAKSFTILADETTDISGVEQFSLCARYVEMSNERAILREDFLRFVPVKNVTGEGLSNTLITSCKDLELNLEYLRGQGYDGAGAMSGKFQGCAARVTAIYPQALYVHCASHSLNLAVGDVCLIPIIRNTLGTINEIIVFFRCSAKREAILNDAINVVKCETKKRRLKKYCETRWIDRLEALITFKEFFLPIFTALENIQESENNETSKKAFIFQQTLKNGSFIVAMVVINEIFAYTEPLSIALQAKYVDLASALDMTDKLSHLLKNIRENSELKFRELFTIAQELATQIGEEVKMPRVINRQVHRENYQCDSPEDYFRIAVFIPFVDHFICQLDQRFLNHKQVLCKIQNIIPNKIVNLTEAEVNETVDVISMQWPNALTTSEIICKKEMLLWQQK